jgi:ornithine carbamoyltransferase
MGEKMDFLKFGDISGGELREVLALCAKLKALQAQGRCPKLLEGKSMVMFFEKNSTRTRLSFEIAMTQLGGHAVFLDIASSQFARGESYSDTGAIAGSMADFVMARVNSHRSLEELSEGSPAPVINGLSDTEHPYHHRTF